MLLSAASLIQWLAMIKLDSVPHRRETNLARRYHFLLALSHYAQFISRVCFTTEREHRSVREHFLYVIYNVLTPFTIPRSGWTYLLNVCVRLSFSCHRTGT